MKNLEVLACDLEFCKMFLLDISPQDINLLSG